MSAFTVQDFTAIKRFMRDTRGYTGPLNINGFGDPLGKVVAEQVRAYQARTRLWKTWLDTHAWQVLPQWLYDRWGSVSGLFRRIEAILNPEFIRLKIPQWVKDALQDDITLRAAVTKEYEKVSAEAAKDSPLAIENSQQKYWQHVLSRIKGLLDGY